MKKWSSSVKNEKGYTLLEYAAGAAVLMGLLYIGVQALGSGVQDLLEAVGVWARSRSGDLTTS
jgi:hypothetical protein